MKHYINDIEVTPENIFDIGVSVDFQANVDQNKITSDSVILANEGALLVKNHINIVGLLEGLPYDIEYAPNKKLGLFIDFIEECQITDKNVQVKLKNRFGHDQFFDRASGLIFSDVNDSFPFDVKDIDFQVVPKDNVTQAIIASVCLFAVTDSLAKQFMQVKDDAIEFANALIPIFGVGLSPTVSVDYGKMITAGLKLAVSIAYFAILVSEAVILATQLFNLIFPITRQLKGCTALELMKKSCKFLGYEFSSTILEKQYSNFMVLPIPLNKTDTKWYETLFKAGATYFSKGYPGINDTTPTLGSLIDSLETTFNAKCKVINGTVQLERWDYYFNQANQNISSSLVLQSERINSYKFDFSRIFKRYVIKFETDYNDLNTLDNFENTEIEYSLDLLNPTDYRLNIIKGLSEKRIPYALVTCKYKANWLDAIMLEMFKAIDYIAGTSFGDKIQKKGIIQLTDMWFGVTKCFMWDGANGVSKDNQTLLYPQYLWDNFHFINDPLKYQYIIKENVKIPMTGTQFVQILNLNYVEIDGLLCEIVKMDYFDGKNFAIITYKEPKNIFEGQVQLRKIIT